MAGNSKVSMKFEGLKELEDKLLYLSKKETRSIFAKGAREGANVVKKYAENTRGRKTLRVSIRSWPDNAEAKVLPKDKFWYDKFIEKGTDSHGARKKGRKYMKFRKTPVGVVAREVRGVSAKPFLKPAFENHTDEIVKAISAGYEKKLAAIMEKK